jgi:hypothetical protein
LSETETACDPLSCTGVNGGMCVLVAAYALYVTSAIQPNPVMDDWNIYVRCVLPGRFLSEIRMDQRPSPVSPSLSQCTDEPRQEEDNVDCDWLVVYNICIASVHRPSPAARWKYLGYSTWDASASSKVYAHGMSAPHPTDLIRRCTLASAI